MTNKLKSKDGVDIYIAISAIDAIAIEKAGTMSIHMRNAVIYEIEYDEMVLAQFLDTNG
jgi:hypothetical protein